MGVARHQPMVADRRRETAAAAALDTMVLKRRLVRSSGESDRVGEDRRPIKIEKTTSSLSPWRESKYSF